MQMEHRWLTASRWVLAAVTALLLAAPLMAGPKVIEESTRIPPPQPPSQFFFATLISVDGNRFAVMSSPRYLWEEVHLYERASSGTWTLVGKVDEAMSAVTYGSSRARP